MAAERGALLMEPTVDPTHGLTSPRHLVRAALLLALEERGGHGYVLLERLGCDRAKPGRVYRALRWLDDAGLVRHAWEMGDAGPARRVYELAPAGRDALDASADELRHRARAGGGGDDELARFVLARLRALASTKADFAFTVTARVRVAAVDEGAARRKIDRLFDRSPLGADVRAAGLVDVVGSP